jgi:DNA excision repair protein ERCC-2
MSKARYTVSVKRLVEFVLKTGDLAGGRGRSFTANRAIEGTRGHQKLQRSQGANYEPEVPVKHMIERVGMTLEINGRIDGVLRTEGGVLIEEIKTTFARSIEEPAVLHLAQAKVYAAIFAAQNSLQEIGIQISYFHLDNDQVTPFRQTFAAGDLADFFTKLCAEYFAWIEALHQWRILRDTSIQELDFPFAKYRAGQRELAVAVYRTLAKGETLFAQAPTGIGKTVSVLFPALKRLPESRVEKIFYLTAKTIGRTVVEETVKSLQKNGLRLRALTLTARDKICFGRDGDACDVQTCSFAIGYYDRRKAAIAELCAGERMTREEVEGVARKHQVCPFALMLDSAEWVDLIICDFNYAFDPSAMLRDFFGEDGFPNYLLIDEAHNLPERAREMFSGELGSLQLTLARDELGSDHSCGKALKKCLRSFQKIGEALEFENGVVASAEPPGQIALPLRAFLEEAEAELAREGSLTESEALRTIYFEVLRFVRVLDGFDGSFQTIYRQEPTGVRIKLYCIDPAPSLLPVLQESAGTVFFSATLSPIDYYRTLLADKFGAESLELGSPFPPENLPVFIEDRIATHFKGRNATYAAVANAIAAVTGARRGNYLIFFPSYKYLESVLQLFQSLSPETGIIVQRSGMNESERDQFLANFEIENNRTLAGFAVMGGIFGEGIDLVGDRLAGAVVVGVGLPQISVERDLIARYFTALGKNGFNYGYVFPGMNRVLQAVGRVIRSETDRGVALLIDERFSRWPYRELLPKWWDLKSLAGRPAVREFIEAFWNASSS